MSSSTPSYVGEAQQQQHVQSGRGVINYSLDKPSNAFSTNTTEFDDILMKKDIVTLEQAMMAKGASYEEAHRLAQEKRNNEQTMKDEPIRIKDEEDVTYDNDTSDEDDDDDDDDDDFFEKYRAMRLKDLKQEKERKEREEDTFSSDANKRTINVYNNGGYVHLISRPDWTREVNDASSDGTWVLILLTTAQSDVLSAQHLDACHLLERDIFPALANFYTHIKFVSIPATHAVANWPAKNLPTIFAYQYGKLSCQLIGLEQVFGFNENKKQIYISIRSVEQNLQNKGVLTTESKKNHPGRCFEEYEETQEDPKETLPKRESNNKSYYYYNNNNTSKSSFHSAQDTDKETNHYGKSSFLGGMSTFATR